MIKRFFVHNFKGLRDFTIHFTEPLSVLAGPNGSGKTSVCQALDLLFRLVRERPADIMREMDPTLLRNRWEKSTKIVMEADVSVPRPDGTPMDLTWHIEIGKKRGWGIAAERVTHHGADVPGNTEGHVLLRRWRRIDVHNHRTSQWERETKELPSYLSTVAEEAQADYPELFALQQHMVFRYVPFLNPEFLRRRTREGVLGSQGENFASYLHRFARQHPSEFQRVVEQLQGFFPTFESLRPVRSKFGWTEVQVQQRFGAKPGSTIFKADQVSDGLLRLAAIATLPGANDGLRHLAIEEPENGMHPRLLEHTVELLRSFGDLQTVVTTHSPVLLNSVRPEEAIVLRNRGPDGPEARPFRELEAGMRRLEYFDIGDVLYEVGEDRLMGQRSEAD